MLPYRKFAAAPLLLLLLLAVGNGPAGAAVKDATSHDSVPTQAAMHLPAASDPLASAADPGAPLVRPEDGSFPLSLPDGWTEDPALNAYAELSASNSDGDRYLMVLSEPKPDGGKEASPSLTDYRSLWMKEYAASLSGMKAEKEAAVRLNGREARFDEFSGSMDGTVLRYEAVFLDGGSRFYQLLFWSSEDRFAEAREDFYAIARSFRLPDSGTDAAALTAQPASSAVDSPLRITGEDGTQMMLPGGWSETEGAFPGASMQADDEARSRHLAVIPQPDEAGITPGTFGEAEETALRQKLAAFLADAFAWQRLDSGPAWKPEALTVNGFPALQTELAIPNGDTPVGIWVTAVRMPDTVQYLIFWTAEDDFAAMKRDLLPSVLSFQLQ